MDSLFLRGQTAAYAAKGISMSLDKKSILATEGLPIVNSVFRSDFEFPGIKTLFRVSHSNGDYLISLAAVLDVLYHVLEADLQAQWNIIPPIKPEWWKFLGSSPEKFFCLDYCHEGHCLLGISSRNLDSNYFLIELVDDKWCRHTMSFECFLSILFAAFKLNLIPCPPPVERYSKDHLWNWFELANCHFRLPILNVMNSSEGTSLYQVDRYSPEVISSEFFRTEDLKNG